MIIKLIQIPAYILLFLVGVVFAMFIFTWFITFSIILIDVMAISLSGINGVFVVCKCGKDGLLKVNGAVLFSLSQFVFCVDVVCAVLLYLKVKKAMAVPVTVQMTNIESEAENVENGVK